MPKMGESIMEGTILEWRKKVGDFVEKDELLLEIGTDKVDSEIPSVVSGTIIEIIAVENDVVDVGSVIAKVETEGNNKKDVKPVKKEKISLDLKIEQEPIKKVEDLKTNLVKSGKKFFTPVVLKIAFENNIPLDQIERIAGSGRRGRVTKKDILLFIKERRGELTISPSQKKTSTSESKSKSKDSFFVPESPNILDKTEEMHNMRKLIADNMLTSLNTSAHAYVMTEVDMTHIVEYVQLKDKEFFAAEGFNLTYTPFIVDATVKSLQNFPEMNASILDTSVTYHKNINIGLAVAIKNGLMVPVMPKCEEKNFLGICRVVNDLAVRTRDKAITLDELSSSTFSITNFGVFGVTMGTPIINQPNVGILGVGGIKKRPVVIESIKGDGIVIRSMMILTLGFDHRLIDGSVGSSFIENIRENLEKMDLSINN